ncbi:COG4705 family protein [Paenibacillus sp. YAF4_2]|uniref:COG4705 family protein n=1 Tax=Paenibacillus sp. YAF4_2 TaxID=3233085 RepID=UPI003F9EB77D
MYIYKAENHSKVADLLVKVPEITLYFWITKLLTTGMGEVASDYLFERLNPLISLPLSVAIFIAAMILQFKAKRYVPSLYWLVVIMVSIFGTTAADVVRVGLGIPYVASTIFFAVMLAAVLITWYIKEGTLSVHHINTRRREIFYWLTVSTTFALGTAAGDMTASNMHLGYLSSGIMFSVVLVIPALGYWLFNMKEVAAFWFAYIMTRPVGASFADWLSASHADGGAGYGKGSVSLILFVIIVLLVFIRGGAPAKIEEHQHSVTNP